MYSARHERVLNICSINSYFSDVGYKYIFPRFILDYGWSQCFHLAFCLLGKTLPDKVIHTLHVFSERKR